MAGTVTRTTWTRRRVVASTAAFGIGAAACAPGVAGTASGGAAAPPAGALKAGTKVAFASWGGPDVQAISKRAVQAFQDQHRGVSVEFISTQGLNHLEKLTAAAAAGTPIDIFYLQPNDTPTLAERGLLRSIDDLVRRDKYDIADFYEKCIGQYRWKGKLYALPRGFGNQDIYYNVSMFDTAGIKHPPYDWNAKNWTADEFRDAATRLKRIASGASGEGWGWAQGTGLRQWAPWVWIFGGDILDKNGKKCILDQAPAVEGLQFLQDLIFKHQVMPPPAAKVNAMNAFSGGQLAMRMDIPAGMTNYRRLLGVSWDVAPMPRKVTRLTSGGGVAWHMSSTPADVNAAWELHKWVAGKEFQTEECQAGTTAPPRKSILKSACFVDRSQPPKGIDTFVQAPEFVHPDPQALGWSDIEAEINKGLALLWDGTRTARQVAQEVVPQVNRLLAAT